MADDLSAIEPWIGGLIDRLRPAERRKLALKVGQFMRRENAKRIAANIQPDGSAMEPRKRRSTRKTGRVKSKGKMFRKIAKAKALKVRASPDGVEIGFVNPFVGKTAAAHHYGEVDFVGKKPDGTVVRTKYPVRRLLGFGAGDNDGIMEVVLNHLTK